MIAHLHTYGIPAASIVLSAVIAWRFRTVDRHAAALDAANQES